MSKKQKFIIESEGGLRSGMMQVWRIVSSMILSTPVELTVSYAGSKRTIEQNKKMWAMLTDFSEQVLWTVNGSLQKITPDEWKDVFTAALRSELRIAEGLDGGCVFLGMSTSKMTVKEKAELIEFMYAEGARRMVMWSEPQPVEWHELSEGAA